MVILSGWVLLEYVIFCFLAWWFAYYVLFLTTRQTEEWVCRLLTLLHGIFATVSAIKDIRSNGNCLLMDNAPMSEDQKGYFSIMLGYFLFDFIWIQIYGKEPLIIHFHHISSIIVLLKIMISDVGGMGVTYGIAGLECTNPYLQTRWFLRTYGYLNTPIHTAVELWFFFLFFLIRLVGGTVLLFYVLKSENSDYCLKLLLSLIYIVSLGLAYDIYKYVRRKYFIVRAAPSVPTS